jgi:hypothetical protein
MEKVYEKIAAVMGELNRIPKGGFNRDQNYKYATAEDVKQQVRQAMAKHKLALTWELAEFDAIEIVSAKGTKGTKLRGRLIFTLGCGETGQSVSMSIWNEAIDWGDKAFNKLYTTAEKYFLINTFLVSTGDEDDTDAAGQVEIKESVKSAKAANPVVSPTVKPAATPQGQGPAGKKLAQDAVTTYWSTAKSMNIEQPVAAQILKNNGGNAVKALDELTGSTQPALIEAPVGQGPGAAYDEQPF